MLKRVERNRRRDGGKGCDSRDLACGRGFRSVPPAKGLIGAHGGGGSRDRLDPGRGPGAAAAAVAADGCRCCSPFGLINQNSRKARGDALPASASLARTGDVTRLSIPCLLDLPPSYTNMYIYYT